MQIEGYDDGQGELESTEPVENTESESSIEVVENVEDDVRKAVEALQGDTEGTEEIEADKEPEKLQETPRKTEQKLDQDLEPPQPFQLEAKEEFNRLPKKMKAEVKRLVTGYRQEFTAAMNHARGEYAKVQAKAKDNELYDGLVKEHLPNWAAQGMTPIQAIAGLVNAQNNILNPQTKIPTLRAIIEQAGVSQEDLFGESIPGSTAPQANIENHPVVKNLVAEINNLRGQIQPVYNNHVAQEQASFNEGVDQIASEINSVRNEKDYSGRYLYPKLHDNQFLKRVNSLVLAIKETSPHLTWADVTKRAYMAAEGDTFNGQTRPPAQIQTRSVGSIRGNAAPIGNVRLRPEQIPDSVEDSVRMSVEKLMRGGY